MKNLKQKAKVFLGICLVALTLSLDSPENAPKTQSTSGFVANIQQIEREKKCIKEALYYEARSEGEEGMRSVMQVIHNRKNAKGFPGTYCKVIHQPLQFSYRNGTQPGIHLELKPTREADKQAYNLAESIAEDAAYGRIQHVLPENVLWYHTKDVKPRWSRFMQRVKTVSKHHFFAKKES